MFTPPKGDFISVPLNPAGRAKGEAWDPAKDEASGEQCKAYGAAGLMRLPTRLHITWQDDTTLKIETDAGTQTRLLAFGRPQAKAVTGKVSLWRHGIIRSHRSRVEVAVARPPTPEVRCGSSPHACARGTSGRMAHRTAPIQVMTEYFDRFDMPAARRSSWYRRKLLIPRIW
jgi:hypothetical protein